MNEIDRRGFLRHATALSGSALLAPSLAALSFWSCASPDAARSLRLRGNGGLGPLAQSVDCPELWIPPDFRVVALSRSLEPSQADASFIVPNGMDGMAAFALPNGNIRLIRNHELANAASQPAPLGSRPYDRLASGGTTSLEVALTGYGSARVPRVIREYVSLSGTHVNCAGGATPWGSWLSCEEATHGPRHGFERPHGYVFDVDVAAEQEVQPVPLPALGRFVHEAIAIDPRTGIVYETEDARWLAGDASLPGSGFYRFLPRRRGQLIEGGRLQILAVDGRPRYSTVAGQRVGRRLPVRWLEIEDPDPAAADHDPAAVFREGSAKGAAMFQRLEGCFWADDSCYFVSTSGGDAAAGQVWRYVPEGDDGGWLMLVFESPSRTVLDSPDNICLSSRGGIIICEDGPAEQYVRALRQDGAMLDIVLQPDTPSNETDPTEFAGSCWSPDEQVLFFNVQGSTRSYGPRAGATYAMWGPWERGGL